MVHKFLFFLVCILVLYSNLNAQKSQTVVYEVNSDPFEIINDSLFLLHVNKGEEDEGLIVKRIYTNEVVCRYDFENSKRSDAKTGMTVSTRIIRHFALSNSRREIIVAELIQLKEVKYGKKAPFQVIIKKIDSHSGKMIKQSMIADLSLDAVTSMSGHRFYIIDQTEDIKILIKSDHGLQSTHYIIDVESATLDVKKSQQVDWQEFPKIKETSVFNNESYLLYWHYAGFPQEKTEDILKRRIRYLSVINENNLSVLGEDKFTPTNSLINERRISNINVGMRLPGLDEYQLIDGVYKLTYPSFYTYIATISHDNKFLFLGYIKLNNLKKEKSKYPIFLGYWDYQLNRRIETSSWPEYWNHYDSELEKVVAYELDSKKIVGVSYYYNIKFSGEYLPADRKISRYEPPIGVFTHNAIKDKLIYFSQDEIKTIDIKGCFTDDNDPPVVEITKPAGTLNGSSVVVSEISGTFSLKGNVKDVSGIQYVKINDQPATVWRDSFSIILSLKEGENEVNIVCSDYKNNISTFYFTILFTQKKPVIIAEKKPVVTILPDVSKYKNLSSGSGFFIDAKGYIVTNHHVINNHKVILVGVFNPSGNNFDIYQAVSVKEDPINDLALLKITSNSFTSIPSLPYRISISDSKVSDKIFVLGYPKPADLGLELKYTEGVINSLSGLKGNPIHYQISANILGGNSGGPLFNYNNGEVVGVIVSKYISGELTNYAIKASVLKKFLSGVPDITIPVVKSSMPSLSHSKYETLKSYVPIILNYN